MNAQIPEPVICLYKYLKVRDDPELRELCVVARVDNLQVRQPVPRLEALHLGRGHRRQGLRGGAVAHRVDQKVKPFFIITHLQCALLASYLCLVHSPGPVRSHIPLQLGEVFLQPVLREVVESPLSDAQFRSVPLVVRLHHRRPGAQQTVHVHLQQQTFRAHTVVSLIAARSAIVSMFYTESLRV